MVCRHTCTAFHLTDINPADMVIMILVGIILKFGVLRKPGYDGSFRAILDRIHLRPRRKSA
ncbi:hypothetical protein FACS1894159_07010 [Bacteroidia bacterium]|nr:hypothetical protein FACS1894159_07010 [Bacteroidia bacterium]